MSPRFVDPSTISRQQKTAEAINGALYRTEFEHLGQQDSGRSDWWTRGRFPQDVRIEVTRSQLAPFVILNIEWRVLGGQTRVKGRQNIQIKCGDDASVPAVEEACERAVLRCLQIYKDVLLGAGVASSTRAAEVDKREIK